MPLNNSGLTQVTSANADISVANGTTAPALTLNSGTGNNQIVKLDGTGKLPNVDGSQLTNISGSTDVSYINQQQLIQNIDILRCLAAASLSISDYSTMFCDIFSDSNGYSNTLDTGNTTALYDSGSKKYSNSGTTSQNQAHGVAIDASGNIGSSEHSGVRIYVNSACTLKKVYVRSNVTASTCRLRDDSNNDIATASISGGEATFSQSLSASTYYRIVFTQTAGWVHYTHGSNGVLPVNQTFINWTDGVFNNTLDSGGYFGNAVSIDVEGAATTDKIVQTNTITVSSDLTAYQLYCKKTTAGSGAVQFKISFDNGSSWSSAKALNTKHTNATTGTSIKLQILLNGTGSGNTADAENYSLMVWY
jgi:hypothetical protein